MQQMPQSRQGFGSLMIQHTQRVDAPTGSRSPRPPQRGCCLRLLDHTPDNMDSAQTPDWRQGAPPKARWADSQRLRRRDSSRTRSWMEQNFLLLNQYVVANIIATHRAGVNRSTRETNRVGHGHDRRLDLQCRARHMARTPGTVTVAPRRSGSARRNRSHLRARHTAAKSRRYPAFASDSRSPAPRTPPAPLATPDRSVPIRGNPP